MIWRRRAVLGAGMAFAAIGAAPVAALLPRVLVRSGEGDILVEIDIVRAPLTAANFLRHVAQGLYDGGHFYRVVRRDNDRSVAPIVVIQGGLDPARSPLPPIAHEASDRTGLRNLAGTIAMARDAPGTATSEFFFNVADNPVLDAGGARGDGKGFAVFGRVVRGMDVVARIDRLPADAPSPVGHRTGQRLAVPVAFSIEAMRSDAARGR